MSGDRNEHMLLEIVMKSWYEMSHSQFFFLDDQQSKVDEIK